MLVTGFIFGLLGSLHCVGMCGPLLLAIPTVAGGHGSFVVSRLVYNVGRVTTYSLIGLIFGLIGQSLVFAGLQRALSVGAGIALLSVLILGTGKAGGALARPSIWVRTLFGSFLSMRSYSSTFILGLANGLLPCGLVYVAGTASIAAGSVAGSMLYMIAFGCGTLPLLLALSTAGRRLAPFLSRYNWRGLVPAAVCCVGVLLIIRGLALNIAYVSPRASGDTLTCPACAPKPGNQP